MADGQVFETASIETAQNGEVQATASINGAQNGQVQVAVSIVVLARANQLRITADRNVVVIGDPRHRFRVTVNGVLVPQIQVTTNGADIILGLLNEVILADTVLLTYNQELVRPLVNAIADVATGEELLQLTNFPVVVN